MDEATSNTTIYILSFRRIIYKYLLYKGDIAITEKVYYNQEYVINEIHKQTGCSKIDVNNMLDSLRNILMEKFSDLNKSVEIKLFPGLKVTSKYITIEQSNLNLCHSGNLSPHGLLYLNGKFSNRFKNEIKSKRKDHI